MRQAIIRACSQGPISDESADDESQAAAEDQQPAPKMKKFSAWADQVTFKSYVDVWTQLLSGLNEFQLRKYGNSIFLSGDLAFLAFFGMFSLSYVLAI